MATEETDRLYTPTEISKILQVSAATVTRAMRTGRLNAFRVGGQWRILGSDVARYIEKERRENLIPMT